MPGDYLFAALKNGLKKKPLDYTERKKYFQQNIHLLKIQMEAYQM